ncbi:MAG TPA: SpoIID/LytB domain-containing protein [Blastocatellia bacterium]|nr:SpoIID/LytB domain-containing protein [Blastocatellia bacterium]
MVNIEKEPTIKVGFLTGERDVKFVLAGHFATPDGEFLNEGDHTATAENGAVKLDGVGGLREIAIAPADFDACRFTVHGVKIGIDFHWERKESQQFQGALKIVVDGDSLTLINELPLEAYLVSVISSEMSALCPAELLRAHAVVSRSWFLAQLRNATSDATRITVNSQASDETLIRWYDRESHEGFDVCADDHCQRYQGISKAFSQSAFDAVRGTRGKVLVYADEICDARYSKSCGGMSEVYRAAWEDRDVPYLASAYDGPGWDTSEYRMPLSTEANAEAWITSSPPAYCGMVTAELLARIVPAFDQETQDSYRWRVEHSQEELGEILRLRLGIDFGRVRALEPLERGQSGRIIRLRIVGENRTLVIGKELEIRRALSRSHLYSSAFVVRPTQGNLSDYPARFTLIGAGWGHGVGLCQIGAAVMADRGQSHQEILSHYFKGTEILELY